MVTRRGFGLFMTKRLLERAEKAGITNDDLQREISESPWLAPRPDFTGHEALKQPSRGPMGRSVSVSELIRLPSQDGRSPGSGVQLRAPSPRVSPAVFLVQPNSRLAQLTSSERLKEDEERVMRNEPPLPSGTIRMHY